MESNQSVDISGNPFQAPNADVAQSGDETYEPKIFAASGRIGRIRYMAYGFIVSMIFMFFGGILAAIAIPAMNMNPETMTPEGGMGGAMVMGILGLVMYIALFVYMFMLARRRLNDLNKSGWMSLLLFLPIANIIVALYMLLWPGSEGANMYGPKPVKNSVGIIIVGVVVPLLFTILALAVAIPAYDDYVQRALEMQGEMQNEMMYQE